MENSSDAALFDDLHKQDLASVSVRRPILILVLNLLIALAGIAALQRVEIRELPDVDRPIVSVRGILPGASPETLDAEVTSIVEGAVSRVAGVKTIRSSSEENNFRIHVEFAADANLEQAAADVREAVSRVERELPESVEQLTVIKAEEDANPIINIVVTSDKLNKEELSLRVERNILPELMTVKGVADTPLLGESQRVLRVVIDPIRLSSYGLAVNDIVKVLEQAPMDIPSGSFRSHEQELLVRVDASAFTEEQIKDIVIRDDTRIRDIAQVFFGPEDAESQVYYNYKPVIGIGIVRQASSNTIDISDNVNRVVHRLNKLHDDFTLTVIEDSAVFIRGSVREVVVSLCYTILIVTAIIWLFFGSLRTTLIPCITIPVALIGTVSGILMMGFSINILTLLAIVLATGLVVDDAIVVLENIQRCRHMGIKARAASVLGTRQVIFAVLATTAVLVSVFVPIGLMPGTTGQMFREFGLVLAVAVAISSFVALTLVPALAVYAQENQSINTNINKTGFYQNTVVAAGHWLAEKYQQSLVAVISHARFSLLVMSVLAVLSALLYQLLVKELLPVEDRGVIYADATGPDGVGLDYMERQVVLMESILQDVVDQKEAIGLYTIVGRYDPNRARVMLPLLPWEERKNSQQDISQSIKNQLAQIPGAHIRVHGPNSLNIRGAGGNIKIAVVGNDYQQIFQVVQDFSVAVSEKIPGLSDPDISYQPTQPQLAIQVDRKRAADLKIPLENIATTLKVAVDGLDVVDLNIKDENIPLLLKTSASAIRQPDNLANLYVANANAELIPLSSVISFHEESVAAELDRHAQRRAIEIVFTLADEYSLENAVVDLRQLADKLLPDEMEMILLDEAATLDETSHEVAISYIIAFLVVFLVLSAQFEGFTSALIILLTIPFGFAAAIFALFITDTSINLFSQIGFILLIGVMAKNGILLVEFADQLRDQGKEVRDAILQAAKVRLRPIALTMFSTVIGGLPLILSSGPGAEARQAIGWVMFGGLGIAAFFTLYLTPVIYLLLGRFQHRRLEQQYQLRQELELAQQLQTTKVVD